VVRIMFHDLKIDQISHSSGVFSGRNMQAHWKHSSKKNEGLGALSGDKNKIVGNASVVWDKDWSEGKD
jgi:hypothetical protein